MADERAGERVGQASAGRAGRGEAVGQAWRGGRASTAAEQDGTGGRGSGRAKSECEQG